MPAPSHRVMWDTHVPASCLPTASPERNIQSDLIKILLRCAMHMRKRAHTQHHGASLGRCRFFATGRVPSTRCLHSQFTQQIMCPQEDEEGETEEKETEYEPLSRDLAAPPLVPLISYTTATGSLGEAVADSRWGTSDLSLRLRGSGVGCGSEVTHGARSVDGHRLCG